MLLTQPESVTIISDALSGHPAVEVILAAPGKVPTEETLYVQKKTFGKVGQVPRSCSAGLSWFKHGEHLESTTIRGTKFLSGLWHGPSDFHRLLL
jgi:hypothetical protein